MSKCYIKKDSLYYCDSEIYRYPPIKKVYYIRDNISTVFVEFNDNGMDNSCFTLDNGFEGEFPLFKKVLPENDYEPFKTTVYFKELPVGEIVLSR